MAYNNIPISPRGMIHTVAVFKNMNAAGTLADSFGDAGPNWQPVADQQAVQCRVIQQVSSTVDAAGKTHDVVEWWVMFRVHIMLDSSNMLQWTDTDGVVRKLVCKKSLPHHGKNHHRSVKCDEVFN